MIWALIRRFKATGCPKNITIICHGGNGGRGRLPGTIDDLMGLKGCVSRLLTSHIDTHMFAKRRMLFPVDESDRLECHILPLGTMSLIYANQAETGEPSHTTHTGLGTVFDPAQRGTPFTPDVHKAQWVRREKDGRLTFSLPRFSCALLQGAAADAEGNVYRTGMGMVSDVVEVASGVRRNGGRVIVTVGLLVPKGYGEILLPARLVDHIVLDPTAELMFGVSYSNGGYPFLSIGSEWTVAEGQRVVDIVNTRLKLTPTRTAKDALMGRLGAQLFCKHAAVGARLNIGTGLPEMVGAAVAAASLTDLVEPFNEGGALGGVSAMGTFFGTAICPKEIVSPAEVYRRAYTRLDCVVVGGLEVDETGSVNASGSRSPTQMGYVGPGGFVDLTCAARLCIFTVAFEAGAQLAVKTEGGGSVSVVKHGTPKFVRKVKEVSFSGPRALEEGKLVFYVTHLGAFHLTREGVQLLSVFSGIDVQSDILDASPMRILLPEGGIEAVEVLSGPGVDGTDPHAFSQTLRALLKAGNAHR